MIRLPAIRSEYRGRALLLGYLAFCVLYLGSHALRVGAPTPLQRGAFDVAIPLLDWSIWIYLSQFILLPLAIWRGHPMQRSRVFYAALLATLIAALIFVVWPTQLERPAVPGQGITAYAWVLLFASDFDGNCFPSLHAALAAIAGCGLWQAGLRMTGVIWPLLIALATLTTKQHIVWDTLGGLGLGFLAWTVIPRLVRYDR